MVNVYEPGARVKYFRWEFSRNGSVWSDIGKITGFGINRTSFAINTQ
jgi:hypothetical protein